VKLAPRSQKENNDADIKCLGGSACAAASDGCIRQRQSRRFSPSSGCSPKPCLERCMEPVNLDTLHGIRLGFIELF
jgi:hypothetical protein